MAPEPFPVPASVPAPDDPTLIELVTRLEEVMLPLGWEQPPCLVGRDPSGSIELCTPPPSADPLGDLVGFVAPDHWSAIGFVATGRVHDMAEDNGRLYGTRRLPEQRARMGHFVDRAGVAVGFLRLTDEPPDVHERGGHGGRVDDICRRALGLATTPPATPLQAYWASRWLERVLADAVASPAHVATWPRVARHHLLVPTRAAVPTVDALIEAGVELAQAASWETMRALVAQGRRPLPEVDAAAARWMDDGMFSRWMLEDLPPLGHLRTAVAEVVPGDVAAAIDAVLDAWGLP